MTEILDEAIIYHTVDGFVKVSLPEEEFKLLKDALSLADELLSRIKLVVYAEQNALLKYRKDEAPALENFGILLRNGKMDKELWTRYKEAIRKKVFYDEQHRSN